MKFLLIIKSFIAFNFSNNPISGVIENNFLRIVEKWKRYSNISSFKRVTRRGNQNDYFDNSKLINIIAHEIRTPLYAIIGTSEIMLEKKGLKGEDLENLEVLKFSSDYLLGFVNNALQLGENPIELLKPDKNHFNLHDTCFGLVEWFSKIGLDSGTNISINFDKNVPKNICADKNRIKQILFYIIDNAVKYTKDGSVFLRLKAHSFHGDKFILEIEVQDEGTGIREGYENRIFDEFFQVERNQNPFNGAGLGLAIVKKLSKILDADINMVTQLGVGTSFFIRIPVLESKNSTSDKQQIKNESNKPAELNKKRILIVDDNKINLMITSKLLLKEGYAIDLANNGKEALKKYLANNNYDLILMDLNMPSMNGFEASKQIRAYNKEIPIIALSAAAYRGLIDDLISAEIDDIISKPFDSITFLRTLSKHLNKSPFLTNVLSSKEFLEK